MRDLHRWADKNTLKRVFFVYAHHFGRVVRLSFQRILVPIAE